MTSHDVRDVLNLPSDNAGPRPSKKARTAAPRPNLKGLAREVQNLGGDNPIAIVPEVSIFKKRRTVSRKPAAKWELKAFTNSARGDDGALVLRHWKRKPDGTEGGQDGSAEGQQNSAATAENSADRPEDSSFAKFNVRVSVPQYSEDQYNANLKHPDWTKEETDYLLELARDFDLRWPIIWDRYEYAPQQPEGETPDGMAVVPASKPRTMEDLKARYYEVAAKMMAVQKPAQYMTRPEFELYEMMLHFDPKQEQNRKRFAENTLKRSNDEAREEEALLLEIKRIMARTERFNEERRELYNRLDYPASESDINSFKTSAGLQSLLQTLLNVDKSKKRKSIMGPENGVPPAAAAAAAAAAPAPPAAAAAVAAAPEATPAASRRESLAASSTAGANDHHEPPAREPPVRHERQESRSHHRNESRSERADRHGGHGHHHRDSVSQTPAATPVEPPTSAPAPAPAANKKKGPQQPERRKLSENEEQVYGVSHHDRLGSGPTFRYEKINKLYSHKSGQQQMRITNLLLELDIPARLIMPTASVTAQFEVLWGAVTTLVDLRKMSDKVDAEIKLEEAKKAEREKKEAEERGETVEKKDAEEGEGDGQGGEAGGAGDKEKDGSGGSAGGEDAEDKSGESSAQTDEQKKDQKAEDAKAQKEQQEEGQDQQKKDGDDPAVTTKEGGGDKNEKTEDAAACDKEAESSSGNQPKIKEEADENGGSNAAGAGSGTQHKRSASVLSNTSERSTKKQKK